MVNLRAVLLVAMTLLYGHLRAQPPNSDCASAVNICAHTVVAGDNTGAGGIPGFCPGTEAMVWYTFTTNSQGGAVTVSLTVLDCDETPGTDDELSVVVLTGNGSCDLDSFESVSAPCQESDVALAVTTEELDPSTTYWIVVAGAMNNGTIAPAQCGFEMSITGPGADIIGVDLRAGPDVEIGEGESTQLQGFSTGIIDWSPTAGLSGNGIPDPIASPESTTIYTISSQINGCDYADSVIVEVVRRVDPPNTFTPNGDGYNDTWEIPGIADYPGAEIVIHDRWGQIVLRSNGYREAWDGTNDGRPLSVGTYYYHIQLNQLEGRAPPYTGFVTIVR